MLLNLPGTNLSEDVAYAVIVREEISVVLTQQGGNQDVVHFVEASFLFNQIKN